MNLPKSAMTQICEDMNEYINLHGQIPRSSFIKQWHDLDNQFWIDVFWEAVKIDNDSRYDLSDSVKRDIERLIDHVEKCGMLHPNILNPDLDVKLPRAATQIESWSVKTVLWRTMMRLREYYCWVNDIDLPNEDSSRGKSNPESNPFEQMFVKSG